MLLSMNSISDSLSVEELDGFAEFVSFMIYMIVNATKNTLADVRLDCTAGSFANSSASNRQHLTQFCSKVITAAGRIWTHQMTRSTVYLALIYVIMLVRAQSEQLSGPTDERKLFLIAFILAHKFVNDDQYQNGTWPSLSGYEGRDLLQWELQYLELLDYDLFVNDTEFSPWSSLLDQCFSHPHNNQLVFNNLCTLEHQIRIWEERRNGVKFSKEAVARAQTRRLTEERERIIREAEERARWEAQEKREKRRRERSQRETGQANIKAIIRLLEVYTEKEKIRQQLQKIEQEERQIRDSFSMTVAKEKKYQLFAPKPNEQTPYQPGWSTKPYELHNSRLDWQFKPNEQPTYRSCNPYTRPQEYVQHFQKLPTPQSYGHHTKQQTYAFLRSSARFLPPPVGCNNDALLRNNQSWNPMFGNSLNINSFSQSFFAHTV